MLDPQPRMPPKRLDQRLLALHGLQPIAGKRSEHGEVGSGEEVVQLMLLQISPDILRQIELGDITGQSLNSNRAVESRQIINASST